MLPVGPSGHGLGVRVKVRVWVRVRFRPRFKVRIWNSALEQEKRRRGRA